MKTIVYEWVGDSKTFETLFTKFYDNVLKDDLLRNVFKNMSNEHINILSIFSH